MATVRNPGPHGATQKGGLKESDNVRPRGLGIDGMATSKTVQAVDLSAFESVMFIC
jgi:hypothetical protein